MQGGVSSFPRQWPFDGITGSLFAVFLLGKVKDVGY
jgi:hypothetical protein